MKILMKSILSTMTAAAVCAANTSAFSANMISDNISVSAEDLPESSDKNTILSESNSGVIDEYYYDFISCSVNDEMELISPSLFKAKWDSTDAEYTRAPVSERGKKFEEGQDYNWIMESSVDYEMNFSAEGSFFVGTHASFIGKETDEYFSTNDMYIIDAAVNWKVPDNAEYISDTHDKYGKYYIYLIENYSIGTGKPFKNDIYYVVNNNSISNGKSGNVSAKHDLAPFVSQLLELNDLSSASLCVGINGDISKGSAELIRNQITVPDQPKFSNDYEHMNSRIYLDNDDHWTHDAQTWADNKLYHAFGYDIEMKGYVGEPIKCTWNYYPDKSDQVFKKVHFNVAKKYDSFSIIDFLGDKFYSDVDDLSLEYSIDIDKISMKTDESYWYIGGLVQCARDMGAPINELSSKLLGNDPISYIEIIDRAENISFADHYETEYYYPPTSLGTITSNGADYDVSFLKAKNFSAYSEIILIRKDEIETSVSDDVPPGCSRYENSFSITDILSKIKELGLDPGGIKETEFTFSAFDTEGQAFLNKADIRRTIPEWKKFSADDIKLLSDYIMGKGNEEPECEDYRSNRYKQMDLNEYLSRMNKDYDLNADGVWDIYDLCLMRKRVDTDAPDDNNPKNYVEPDNSLNSGFYYNVIGDDVKLYLGPDKSYEAVESVPTGVQLYELGYQNDNSIWFFTKYNGQYGWVSTNDAVSLAVSNSQWGKPVICIYPEHETDVHIELELTTSDLSTTYPKYNNGWDVTAYPDGSLINKTDGTHHRYLFWESVNARTKFDFSKGYCVAGKDTETFLKEKLSYIGLNEEETNEFIVYWLPKMEHNQYNLITFQGDLYTDAAKLSITPSPDSLLRLFMAYVPLEEHIDIEPQQLDTFERKGFTVVEWGGTEIK